MNQNIIRLAIIVTAIFLILGLILKHFAFGPKSKPIVIHDTNNSSLATEYPQSEPEETVNEEGVCSQDNKFDVPKRFQGDHECQYPRINVWGDTTPPEGNIDSYSHGHAIPTGVTPDYVNAQGLGVIRNGPDGYDISVN